MGARDSVVRERKGRIKDARGRPVTQLDPVALQLLRRHEVIDAATLGAITGEKGVRVTAGERALLICGLCGAVLVLGLFTYAVLTGDIRDATLAKSSGLVYLCGSPWGVWFIVKARRFGHVRAAMLKHRRCPHCGYDLRMLPVDPADDATVCPECGCAWLLGGVEAREGRDDG